MVQVKARRAGASAVIRKTGPAEVTSATGGHLTLNASASDPTFSPLDLLFASIAGCLVVSARQAAGEMGIADRIEEVRASVHGRKAAHPPARVERIDIRFEVDGDLDEPTRHRLIARAEELCTVSNTVKGSPEFVLNEKQDA